MDWPNHVVTLDFETYWDSAYTLKTLSTENYVRHALFKAHGASFKYGSAPSRWVTGRDLPALFASIPWHDVALLCQHAQFDGLILSHHFGVKPALYLDTLSMARVALPRQRHSLAELSRHFGLPPKGTMLAETKGIRDLPPELEARLGFYSCGDGDNTYDIFQRLKPMVPLDEWLVIDTTIRLFTEPRLVLNRQRARNLLAKTIRAKRSALQRLGVKKEELSSTDKFAKLLDERFGLEVEQKPGKPKKDGTPRWLPALAKTDPFMKSLLEHENPDIQAIAALRLSVKSTIEEARLSRLLSMHDRGPLCVYLKHAGAHTLRWSGGDGINWQNFTRGSEVRQTLEAPEGYVLVVVDKSQIEARVLLALAEQWDVLELFEKGDPYSAQASDIFEKPINKKDNPLERQLGKVVVLGSGYGMGGRKLRAMLRIGAMGAPVTIIPLETASEWIDKYRKRNPKVVQYWGAAETVLCLLDAKVERQPWGPMLVDRGYIRLPNGTALHYTGLCREEGEWRMRDKYGELMRNQFGYPIRLYGGMVTENVVQALSRVNLAEDMVAMKRDGFTDEFPIVMTTHDELVCIAPEARAEECQRGMMEYMTKRPSWLPQIPLAAEGGYDRCYSK